MKRLALALAVLTISCALSSAQAPGFGINGATGSLEGGGEVSEISQRVQSSGARYKLTPGDTYQLVLIVEGQAVTYSLILQDNCELDVPYIGTISVKGMNFADLRKLVIDQVKKALKLASYVSLVLQYPARFDVPVFGAVQTPGIVTVTPISMVSDAITLAKGLQSGGSYRQIKLLRGGKEIAVDLQMYNSGQSGAPNNPYLEPGDRILVPTAQIQVTLAGPVRYPGTYELLPGETLSQLILYAGGLLPDAQAGSIEVVRFASDGAQSQLTLDARVDGSTALANGDRVRIRSVAENREVVLVTGGLYGAPVQADKPAAVPAAPISVTVPWIPGLSVLQVLEALGGPTPYARGKDALLIRKRTGDRVPVDVEALWRSRNPAGDVQLEPGDTVSVPVVSDVFVTGQVRTAGKVAYQPSFTVADYLRAAGGIDPQTGSATEIYVVDALGNRTRVGTSEVVGPGTVILVDRNGWAMTQQTFSNITVVTAFVSSIVGLGTAVLIFLTYLRPLVQ